MLHGRQTSIGASIDTLIIGAGMAGLRAAALLRAIGQHVTVVDKGRSHGGRMATRRVEDAVFDTGVLDFMAHSGAFRTEMSAAVAAGHASSITRPTSATRWRGSPTMRSLPTALAAQVTSGVGPGAPVTLRLATTVTSLGISDGRWVATLAEGSTVGQHTADALIVTAPAPQSMALLRSGDRLASDATLAQLDAVTYASSLTALVRPVDRTLVDLPNDDAFERASEPPDARTTIAGDLLRVHHNGHTGASPVVALTLQPSATFSAREFDGDRDAAAAVLVEQASELAGTPLEVVHVHGWRYAQVEHGIDLPALRDDTAGAPLVLAGDLFLRHDVEGHDVEGNGAGHALRLEGVERAFLSGSAAALLLTTG